ncbi:thiol-disulfide oxidoreductase ResA [Virgibacillus dakarensis]|uniref:thiol-disulfide oxidoreductase ResA n=1 Tax=Virgibacillus dakarensis TaxID=1917889 RepID=UPI000B42FC8D|nr:thiol-disulfide oxidoreductase ResA [Virgibacillus dakarensis]
MRKRRLRKYFRVFVLLLLLSAVVYALYLNVNKDNTVVSVGDYAPNFSLETLQGERVELKDYRGKGVFLNFWGTWCKPCKVEMPYMEEEYKKFKEQGVEILAVNIEESDLIVQNFVDRYGLTFPILMDRGGAVTGQYKIGPIPTTYLIDENGKVLKIITGNMNQESVREYMKLIKPS